MPFSNQLHVNRPLSNVSVKYRNNEFIAMDVLPPVEVKKTSDSYFVFANDFRIPATIRANKGLAAEHFWEMSTATYVLEKHALKEYISNDDKENYDAGSLEVDTVEELTDKILMRHELSVAALFTTTSFSLNVSLAATGAWNSNSTVSDPVPVFQTGATEVIGNAGLRPNFVIIPRDGYVAFQNHISVLDRVKYTNIGVTESIIKGLLEVETVFQPIAMYDSSARGATTTMVSIWNNDIALIGYKENRPRPKSPCVGYTFRRGANSVKKWRVEERDSDAIEVGIDYVPKIVASLAAFLIKDTV